MNWERFILSEAMGLAVIIAMAGVALLVAGLGYRRLGFVLAVSFGVSIVVSVVAWFLGLLVALRVGTRGEGAGVAALLFAFMSSGIAGLAFMLGAIGWIYRNRERYVSRMPVARGTVVMAVFLLLFAAGIGGAHLIRVTPGLMSERALTMQSAGLDGPLRAKAREELLSRGADAVPTVIAALQDADRSDLYTFESGLNGQILFHLALLGELGGPAAIEELRGWLNSDYAPDIRATAARGLGEAGDSDSAHTIALLLEERSYEWRKCHFDLLRALTLLNAKDELPFVRSALQFTPDEEGTSFQTGLLGEGITALVTFDRPEAWAIVEEVANGGSIARKETVERVLRELNKSFSPGNSNQPEH